jgi:hypothetical protein
MSAWIRQEELAMQPRHALVIIAWALLMGCGGEEMDFIGEQAGERAEITGGPILRYSPVTTNLLSEVGRPKEQDCTLVSLRPGYPENPTWSSFRDDWNPVTNHEGEVAVWDKRQGTTYMDWEVKYVLEDAVQSAGDFMAKAAFYGPENEDTMPGQVKVQVRSYRLFYYFIKNGDDTLAGKALVLNFPYQKYKNFRRLGYANDQEVYAMDALVIALKRHTNEEDPKIESTLSCKRIHDLEQLPWEEGGCYWFAAPEGQLHCF